MNRDRWARLTVLTLGVLVATTARAFDDAPEAPSVDEAVGRGVAVLMEMQEGGKAGTEWPYEGVYRVRGQIPIGYRVGGTGIVGTSLVQAPGYDEDTARQDAVRRAVTFVAGSIDDPLMTFESIEPTYDVRGWGYAYGLSFLCALQHRSLVPDDQQAAVDAAIRFYIDGIDATEIPENGGWNYARRAGFDAPGAPSPFMTGSTLQALFAAAALGYEVDGDVVDRGLSALERARTGAGGYVYAGASGPRSRDGVPGATGRMLVSEVTLHLGGRGSVARVRGAIDAFIVHWDWLEQRRQQTGTHVRPYGVAPYYFYYAHYFAAQAIEQLPDAEREEYRRRFRAILFRTREEDGSWNDRVFDRSANYGTAMSLMSLLMPDQPAVARWEAP